MGEPASPQERNNLRRCFVTLRIMRTTLRLLSLFAMVVAAASCKSSQASDAVATELLNTPVYTRVGMHFDAKRGRYVMETTNYISVPTYVPPGTRMTLQKVTNKGYELTGDNGSEYVINFVSKHSLMTMEEWREQNFSSSPVELPATLTDDERDAIAAGEARVGMSREAVFLAIGYPPKSTNPSLSQSVLTYEFRRFMRRSIRFDDNDKVDKIGV